MIWDHAHEGLLDGLFLGLLPGLHVGNSDLKPIPVTLINRR